MFFKLNRSDGPALDEDMMLQMYVLLMMYGCVLFFENQLFNQLLSTGPSWTSGWDAHALDCVASEGHICRLELRASRVVVEEALALQIEGAL